MDIFLEGIRAAVEPCSLALVLPAMGAVVLGARRAWAVALGFWLAAVVLAWAQASVLLDVGQGPVTGVVLGVLALAGLGLLWLARDVTRADQPEEWGQTSLRLLAGLVIGTSAGLLWQPCVGPELGVILTAAPRDPGAQLGPLAVYLAGVLLVTASLATFPFLHDRAPALMETAPARLVALIPVVGLAVVLVTGQYEEIIGALVRASSIS
ncbi:hypothetical protein [Euzebya tangerina]|uniref:hypothetical protein n=1 Tax=Euzebya tangerina TaxID=591198 RepID=UPI000E31C0C0|nr:hypothetical protein [Euzebya tangerina]